MIEHNDSVDNITALSRNVATITRIENFHNNLSVANIIMHATLLNQRTCHFGWVMDTSQLTSRLLPCYSSVNASSHSTWWGH